MTEDPNDPDPSTFFHEPTFRDLRLDTARWGQVLEIPAGDQSKLVWPDGLSSANADPVRSLVVPVPDDLKHRVPTPQVPDWLHRWELTPLQRLLLRLAGLEVRGEHLLFHGKRLAKVDPTVYDS